MNHYTASGPLSSFKMVTQNPGAAASNWVFFAVTYNPALTRGQVKFYFGRSDKGQGLMPPALTSADQPTRLNIPAILPWEILTRWKRSILPPAPAAALTRGLVDQFRVYTNVLTIDQIQQVQIENSVVPPVAATILRQPTNIAVTAAPFKFANFTVEATGSGLITYQWRTNGVLIPGRLTEHFLADGHDGLSGRVVSVYVDNGLTVYSRGAQLQCGAHRQPTTNSGRLILPNDDVFVDNSGGYNAWSQSQQINWGLRARTARRPGNDARTSSSPSEPIPPPRQNSNCGITGADPPLMVRAGRPRRILVSWGRKLVTR